MSQKIRVRFAPSPTGPLHIGGLRTALFNYLFARKNNGTFILRIEDTDQTRYVNGAEEYITESLVWCRLNVDEGVAIGGDYGPYRQSERKAIYKEYIKWLIENEAAYYAFDTPEELEGMRKEYEAQKKTFSYDATIRGQLNNSLALTEEEVKKRLEEEMPYVVRFKMPEDKEVVFNDLVREKVVFNTSTLDDKILFKSDGLPTYHFANVVDDHLMQISHVIRGEEWLPSTPLHVLLYESFGWQHPEFAHIPLILKPSGQGKLSKRDGDKMGFPVFPLQWKDNESGEVYMGYRENGYFPEAVINILAFLGWNPGNEQEIFSMDELINHFSLQQVGKAGARFDPEKARWYNQHYMKEKSDETLTELFMPVLKKKGIEEDAEYVKQVVSLVKERVAFVSELWEQSYFFFEAPDEYDKKVVKKRWKENTPDVLRDISDIISETGTDDPNVLGEKVKAYINDKELSMGQVMNVLRLSLVGAAKGPDLFMIIHLIGKEEALKRIEQAVNTIKK